MTMTLSGGTTWAYDEDLTLTASAAYFSSSDVGDGVTLTDSTGNYVRCIITAYTSSTVVTVRPHKTVPSTLRNTALTTWSKAIGTVTGLWHLEGKSVSILADGYVSANPNNPSYTIRTVTNGQVSLDEPHSVIHVGLPYISDIETLDIETTQGQSLQDKQKHVSSLDILVESTRGLWAGIDANRLIELKMRRDEKYGTPISLATGNVHLNIRGEWNSNGKVLIRQLDPLPIAILSVVPAGYIAR